jgi:hypothetical protein
MRVLFLLAFVLLPAHADLYRWIDPDTGSVRLSSLPPSDSSVDAEVVPFKAAATLPPAVARPGAVATARETLQARWSDLLRQLTGMSQQDFNRAGAGVRQQIEAYQALSVELDRLDPAGAARRRHESASLLERFRQGLAAQLSTVPPGQK